MKYLLLLLTLTGCTTAYKHYDCKDLGPDFDHKMSCHRQLNPEYLQIKDFKSCVPVQSNEPRMWCFK